MDNNQEILSGPYARFYQRFGDPTEELHAAYNPWLDEMANREGSRLEPFEFDLEQHSEQSVYVPKVDAKPAFPWLPDSLYYRLFTVTRWQSLGALTTRRLVNQMSDQPSSPDDPTPLPQRLNANQREGKNTLVLTSHINFQELGYVRALRHIVKRDREHIDQCGAVFNSLMTRQKYKGKKLVNRFTPVGAFYKTSPVSASATKHGVPENAAALTNALFMKVLKEDLKKGGLELDMALTGSEIKKVSDENGNFSHYFIPDVPTSSAKLVESFDEAVAITLVGKPIIDRWQMHISDILDVHDLLKTHSYAEVTDMLYADNIVGAVERFTHKDVQYNRLAPQIGKIATVDVTG